MSEAPATALRLGIEHFNRGEYFEAHEAWESLWLAERGPLADFYKGLVQCAAALHHLRRGNLVGARRLHERQRGYLSRFAPVTLEVPVGRLVTDMDALFSPLPAATTGRPVAPDPARFPRITLAPSRD